MNNLMNFEIYKPLIPFVLGLLLKIALDVNLGKCFVKFFFWISFRGIFRKTSVKVSGVYKQYWHIGKNERYPKVCQRQSLVTLKQLNNYCYGEFYAKEGLERYYLFGEIIDRKIIGHWSSYESKLDYFGSFELTILSSKKIKGVWIGHSSENPAVINQHDWMFTAVVPNYKFLVPILFNIKMKRLIKQLTRTQKKAAKGLSSKHSNNKGV
ncbi:hypothetical protein [Pedobacter sp. SL55]|uniref:hypothetical protein n=1 Tax=Pedobacter sp. SL55 TaxID=2995161 RepID=UPI00226DA2EA|nr:hypothetical protein [Pedobacter sp. SL55]WAC42241.1 hypothetical protein OVA16_07765 [Pedobacter sp. SL55]